MTRCGAVALSMWFSAVRFGFFCGKDIIMSTSKVGEIDFKYVLHSFDGCSKLS